MAKDIETRIISRWQAMMTRCYNKEWKVKNPTYKDATVCGEWQDYPTFRMWAMEHIQQIELGWDLDKDLMSGENRIYSPDTCVFLPAIINRTLPKFRIWEDGKTDGKSAYTMYEFAKALEDGKDLIPTHAYKKLNCIVSGYKSLYLEKTGKELGFIPVEERKGNKGGRRDGSGRKALGKKAVTLKLSQEAVAILLTVKNKSEYVDDLIIGKTTQYVTYQKTLTEYTDDELRCELERRGYRGELTKGKILTFGNE